MRATASARLVPAVLALCLLALFAVAAHAAQPATESPYVAGLERYRRGDYAGAADVLRRALEEQGGGPAVPAPEVSATVAPPVATPGVLSGLPGASIPAQNFPSVSPDAARVRAVLGFALLGQNQLAEAEEQFALVRRAEPVDALNDVSIRSVGVLGLGWSAFVRGRTVVAARLLREAIKEAEPPVGAHPLPDILRESVPAHARFGLGLIALGRGRATQARKLLEEAAKGPNVLGSAKELWLALGDARALSGDAAGAQAAWAEVPRLAAQFPEDARRDELARLQSARLLESGGDRAGALAAFAALAGGKHYAPEGLQGQARVLLALGRSAEALPVLQRLVVLEPNLAEPLRQSVENDPSLRPAYKDWGMSYFHQGQYEAALANLSAYLDDVDSDDYECRMALGWSALRLGYAERAKEAFAQAAALRPKAVAPLAGQGDAVLALGQPDEAKKFLDGALAVEPGNALALNAFGHLEFARGDAKKALGFFRASLKSRPDYVESRLAVAHILFGQGDYDAAAAEYFRLVTREKRSTAGWTGLGWARLRLEQYADAEQAFREARRLNPSQPAAAYGLGITFARQGKAKQALQYLAESIFLSPEFSATPEVLDLMRKPEYTELFLEMGESYARKLYPTSAAPYLEKYLSLNPNSRPGRRALGWASFWAGQEDKAHALFRTLLIVNKNDPDAHLGDGLALLSRDHLAMAEPHLRDAVRLDPGNVLAWRALALLLKRQGKTQEAAAALASAPKSRLDRLDRMSARGFLALEEGRLRDAMDSFHRAVRLDPGLAAPHYGLAFALVSLGDSRQARQELLSGLNLDPSFLGEQDLAKLLADHVELGGLALDLAWSQLYALDLPAARHGFQKILGVSPGNMGARFGLGETAYLQADWALAESCFDALLPHAPSKGPSWDKWSHLMDKMGWAAYHQKRYTKALHAFDWLRTYHRQTPYAMALAGMGWALLAKDKPAQAQNLFLRSLSIFPHNLTAMQGLRALEKATSTDEEEFDETAVPLPERKGRRKSRAERPVKVERKSKAEARAEKPEKAAPAATEPEKQERAAAKSVAKPEEKAVEAAPAKPEAKPEKPVEVESRPAKKAPAGRKSKARHEIEVTAEGAGAEVTTTEERSASEPAAETKKSRRGGKHRKSRASREEAAQTKTSRREKAESSKDENASEPTTETKKSRKGGKHKKSRASREEAAQTKTSRREKTESSKDENASEPAAETKKSRRGGKHKKSRADEREARAAEKTPEGETAKSSRKKRARGEKAEASSTSEKSGKRRAEKAEKKSSKVGSEERKSEEAKKKAKGEKIKKGKKSKTSAEASKKTTKRKKAAGKKK